jgi:cytochrome c-type biogenesis protein CcmH
MLGAGVAPCRAVEPDEILPDPALEQRARDISTGLRCLVCQNQSIDDSHAPLARDLRLLVRERLRAGDTNTQVTDYVVQRYGDFVLLKPPLRADTLILWLAPLLVLIAGIWLAMVSRKTMRAGLPASDRLSKAESAKLDAILKDENAGTR